MKRGAAAERGQRHHRRDWLRRHVPAADAVTIAGMASVTGSLAGEAGAGRMAVLPVPFGRGLAAGGAVRRLRHQQAVPCCDNARQPGEQMGERMGAHRRLQPATPEQPAEQQAAGMHIGGHDQSDLTRPERRAAGCRAPADARPRTARGGDVSPLHAAQDGHRLRAPPPARQASHTNSDIIAPAQQQLLDDAAIEQPRRAAAFPEASTRRGGRLRLHIARP